jgi:predicted nucleotidyltransferase
MNFIPKIEDILKVAKMHPSRVFNIYLFGSRIYETHTENSDWDVIIVGKYSVESIEIKNELFNIHIYTPDKWQKDLDWHMPKNIECQFAPSWAKLKEDMKFKFKLDHPKLRHATSQVSSNSWVKAKKKLLVADEYNIGIKSLFHAIRIPMFSNQLAEFGMIKDFKCANHIWERICEKEWTWEELDKEFRQEHNSVLTEFRKLVSKE